MVSVMLHIYTKHETADMNVCYQIELPAVPRVGECVYLSDEIIESLNVQARSAGVSIAEYYYPEYFYGESKYFSDVSDKKYRINEDDLQNLNFADRVYSCVVEVVYNTQTKTVHVMLGDD